LGREFTDPDRLAKRGTPLAGGWSGALVEYRADLLEMITALGFTRWDNVVNPCFKCSCTKADMFNFPTTMESSVWVPRDAAAYNAMIAKSVVKVNIRTTAQLKLLLRSMRHDSDLGGFATYKKVPSLGMNSGYRLIETGPVTDIHTLSSLVVPAAGLELTFFDNSNGVGMTLLCPLFQVKGFNVNALHLDIMHIVDLGVSQFVLGMIFWLLCKNNFCKSTKATAPMRAHDNLMHLRRQMERPLRQSRMVTVLARYCVVLRGGKGGRKEGGGKQRARIRTRYRAMDGGLMDLAQWMF